jgi:hypothetical protein
MSVNRSARLALVAAALAGAASLAAQSGGQMPPIPKPGPEHALLKMDVGTWDAVVEITMAPGAPAEKSKGVEINTLGCGGLCLITDFKGDMMGGTFEGHGVTTYDPAKKKYVGSWTDSMSTGLALAESTYDPAKKTWSGWMEGPDMTGKVVRSRSTVEIRGENTRVFTMYSPGPDGKDMQGMRITYTRRK